MESASSCCLGSRRSRWGFLPEQPEGTTKRLLDEHSQFMVANKVTADTLQTWPWCLEAHITKVHLKASLYHLRQGADFLELFAKPPFAQAGWPSLNSSRGRKLLVLPKPQLHPRTMRRVPPCEGPEPLRRLGSPQVEPFRLGESDFPVGTKAKGAVGIPRQ